MFGKVERTTYFNRGLRHCFDSKRSVLK